MEHKTCLVTDFKMLDEGSGSFEGYASIFGNFDRVNEAVVKGAFSNVDDFIKSGFGAVGHDWSGLPIATIADAKQDDIGLWIKADFHSTKDAQDARTVIQERLARGKFVGLSIGYEVNDSEYVPEGRLLKALTIYEASLVTVPANPLAGVNASKSSSPTNIPLEDHSAQMLANAKDYTKRLLDVFTLRQKDGRALSKARHEELIAIKQVVDNCLEAVKPLAEDEAVRSLYAKFLAQRALVTNGDSHE